MLDTELWQFHVDCSTKDSQSSFLNSFVKATYPSLPCPKHKETDILTV